jgi:hypothetical protein
VNAYLHHIPSRHDRPYGCDVHDTAAAGSAHFRYGGLGAEGIPLHVHSENRVPALLAGLWNCLIEPHASVVHQDIQPAKAFDRAPDESGSLGFPFHTSFNEQDFPASRQNLGRNARSTLAIHVRDSDACPLLQEETGGRLSDA